MGLWWFRWIVFSFLCIGLATSFTSSKSYCINSILFYFCTKLCCCEFCKCCIKLPLNPFYLHQIQHMNTGTKCQHMRQLAVLQLLFWETRKIVGTWFEIILSAMWLAKPWGTFVVFCWSVSYADYFLMFVFHVIFYSVQPDTVFLAVVAFFPDFVLSFYFFQSGWSVLWPSKIFQTLKLFSHGVQFNKAKSAWPEQLVFWFLMCFLI